MKQTQIYMVVGSGGVGKTTVASVLGLYCANLSQKTLVITVDPARRLYDALGLEESIDAPHQVNIDGLLRTKPIKGSLYAFMPNLKAEWNNFLRVAVEAKDQRHHIENNHFYEAIVAGFPGALEIICSHILFRLKNSGEFDTIIMDTPPSSHSVSFFDVPKKVSNVLENSLFNALIRRRESTWFKLSKRIASFSTVIVEKTFERLIGTHFFSELMEFALALDNLYEPLLARTRAMDSLIKDAKTRFILVSRPTTASLDDSVHLKNELQKRGINIYQTIVNALVKEKPNIVKEKQLIDQGENSDAILKLLARYEAEIARQNTVLTKFENVFKNCRYLYKNVPSDNNFFNALLTDYQREPS